MAQLTRISFSEPESFAELEVSYNLVDKKLDLHALLHTAGKLADTKSGFTSLVLKTITPFMKKKSVTVVPFSITGTSNDPTFSLDLTAKR